MPYFTTSEEWRRQSSLLLQARPTTTRITTKYNIPNLDSPKYAKKRARNEASKSRKDAKDPKSETAETEPAQPRSAKAYLELKTYDPESGVTLKYKTDKAAEVGRLIASLGRMGRYMAALPEIAEDVPMVDAPAAELDAEKAVPQAEVAPAADAKGQAGGGKSKKKKGKR